MPSPRDTDEARWARCLAYIPSLPKLQACIDEARARIPHAVTEPVRFPEHEMPLDRIAQPDAHWYARPWARRLLELFIAHFMPKLVREIGQPRLDFDACIDPGYRASDIGRKDGDVPAEGPDSFRWYVERWVQWLRDDATFMSSALHARRVWVVGTIARQAGARADSGHQLLVVADAFYPGQARVSFTIVDNLKASQYDSARWPIHAWLTECLTDACARVGWQLDGLHTLRNGMRTAFAGPCMYLSTRALMACALLEVPWRHIMQGDEQEDARWELFIMAHLERMRASLLLVRAPSAVLAIPQGPPLHSLMREGVQLWRVPDRRALYADPMRRWPPRGAARLFFNPWLKAEGLTTAAADEVCRVMACFQCYALAHSGRI